MADIKQAFGSVTSITCTLTSVADNAARQSAVVTNVTNLYLDVILRLKLNGQAGGTGLVHVYAYAALNDTIYTAKASGSDAAYTLPPDNAIYLGSIEMNEATAVIAMFSLAEAFGGKVPPKWGLIFENQSGAALSATAGDFDLAYQGVYATSV